MTTLFIRMMPKATADAAENWLSLVCPFAVVNAGGAIEREAVLPLSDIAAIVPAAQRVTLLLAASDVSLLRIQVPPLSDARLKAALPGLVEDRLISDPSECILVAGAASEGLRTVAVVQRDWLERLFNAFTNFGARQIAALPAQLCLPYEEGRVSAAVINHETETELTLRTAQQEGMGLAIVPENRDTASQEVLQTLAVVVPQAPIALYVPQEHAQSYQQALEHAAELGGRITLYAETWADRIEGARQAAPNLATGLAQAAGAKLNWRKWKWPVVLAGLLLLVNIIALNVDWWRMQSEAAQLRASMTQVYRSTFPKDTVIVDPLAQMRQKVAASRRGAGGSDPDDFAALAAGFGEVWNSVTGGAQAANIAALEYRDRTLFVRLKPGTQPPTEDMKAALAERKLMLTEAPAQGNATVWQIRSAK